MGVNIYRYLQLICLFCLLLLTACGNITKVEYHGTADLEAPLRGNLSLSSGEHEASFGLIRSDKDNYRFYLRIKDGHKRLALSSLKKYSAKQVKIGKNSPLHNIRIPFASLTSKSNRPNLVIKLSNEDRINSLKDNMANIPENIGFNIYNVRKIKRRYYVGKKVGQFFGTFSDLDVDGKES